MGPRPPFKPRRETIVQHTTVTRAQHAQQMGPRPRSNRDEHEGVLLLETGDAAMGPRPPFKPRHRAVRKTRPTPERKWNLNSIQNQDSFA
jgi:hypothetical protein